METLTSKQRANRLYYAKHSEKIKSQKREKYAKSIASKTEDIKKIPVAKVSARILIEDIKKIPVAKVSARILIEDLKMIKELGVEGLYMDY